MKLSSPAVPPSLPQQAGTLVLDPVSAPSWRLDCSRCSFLLYLPKNLHGAKVRRFSSLLISYFSTGPPKRPVDG